MSVQSKHNKGKLARRTTESMLAEAILCKKLKWDFGFLSGGHKAYSQVEFKKLLELIYIIYGDKFYINVGPLSEHELLEYKPYIKGVVAAIETVEPKLHDFVCPSKPIKPFEEMLKTAEKLGLKKAITIIIGLGETFEDFELLKKFIEKHNIDKIHFYSLNPQKGTYFEDKEPPKLDYYCKWIASTRIAFPKIDIEAGIWTDRVEWVSELFKAGANSVSKFPIIKQFGSKYTEEIDKQTNLAGRNLVSEINTLPDIDWDNEIDILDIGQELKIKVKEKLHSYLKSLNKNM